MTPKPSELLAEWRELEAKGEVIFQPAEGEDGVLIVVGRDFNAVVDFDPLMVTLLEDFEDASELAPVTQFVLDRLDR